MAVLLVDCIRVAELIMSSKRFTVIPENDDERATTFDLRTG